MHSTHSRRNFLSTLSAAGAAGNLWPRRSLADEAPPETTTIRLSRYPGICGAPVLIADELLRAEGFTEIRRTPDTPLDAVARGEVDFDFDTTPWIVSAAGRRRADHRAHRTALRMLRAVRARADPHHPRSEGQEGRNPTFRRE